MKIYRSKENYNFQFIALFKNEKNRIRFAIDCKSSGFSI